MGEFEKYMEDVFSQLDEFATEEHKRDHVTYTYNSELINNHLDYFERCMGKGLSAYKALLYFSFYLKGEMDI